MNFWEMIYAAGLWILAGLVAVIAIIVAIYIVILIIWGIWECIMMLVDRFKRPAPPIVENPDIIDLLRDWLKSKKYKKFSVLRTRKGDIEGGYITRDDIPRSPGRKFAEIEPDRGRVVLDKKYLDVHDPEFFDKFEIYINKIL